MKCSSKWNRYQDITRFCVRKKRLWVFLFFGEGRRVSNLSRFLISSKTQTGRRAWLISRFQLDSRTKLRQKGEINGAKASFCGMFAGCSAGSGPPVISRLQSGQAGTVYRLLSACWNRCSSPQVIYLLHHSESFVTSLLFSRKRSCYSLRHVNRLCFLEQNEGVQFCLSGGWNLKTELRFLEWFKLKN